jgi:putative DNA primase/helicase
MRMIRIGEVIDTAGLKVGENRLPCPSCDRGPSDKALSVRLESDGSVIWICHRCGMSGSNRGGSQSFSQQVANPPAPTEKKRPGLSDYGRQLWAGTGPLSGAALDYLLARSCVVPPADGDLRYLPALKHPSGYVGPVLVALITDVCTGEPLSLHRTWIQPDGRKADVSPPRLLLKDHPIRSGVIRLWPSEAVTAGLGIAEGIETALSLAHGFAPVWACIDAGHMARFPVLPGIEELVIAADNDPAGRVAADDCARRWAAAASVRIVAAEAEGADLNDEVREWVK